MDSLLHSDFLVETDYSIEHYPSAVSETTIIPEKALKRVNVGAFNEQSASGILPNLFGDKPIPAVLGKIIIRLNA